MRSAIFWGLTALGMILAEATNPEFMLQGLFAVSVVVLGLAFFAQDMIYLRIRMSEEK